jgi:hypothetical protein
MRTTVGIVLGVAFAAALAMLIESSSHVSSTGTAPAEASSTPMLPIELMKKSGKDLPDNTVHDPF